MSQLDQFESIFRSAAKTRYHHESLTLNRWLIVTDLNPAESQAFSQSIQKFLGPLGSDPSLCIEIVGGEQTKWVEFLLKKIEDFKPDLICTYRNLHSDGWKWPYSLGEQLDVLSQYTQIPVLVMPHPRRELPAGDGHSRVESVIAVTDHLTGDDRLVNHAVHFTNTQGVLVLAHVEDQYLLDRYLEAISKIPTLDTDIAKKALPQQLLKEAEDYIRSCQAVLQQKGSPIQVEALVTMGHKISEYKAIIDTRNIDLLVINTKDDDQMAMHGLAYPLAVELRNIPMLLL